MANYPLNFRGIVDALAAAVVEAGGTLANYPANFEGVIDALEDLKTAIASGGGGGGTTNHALLSNLSYAASGHTGFASSGANSNVTSLEGVTGIITVGGKKHTRSATVPTSPAVGDTWEELNGSGLIVADWFWNGTLWLRNGLPRVEASFAVATGTFPVLAIFRPQFGYNLYLETFTILGDVGTTNDLTNYHSVTLQNLTTINNGGGAATIATLDTSAVSSDQFFRITSTLNQQITLSQLSGTSSTLDSSNFLGVRTSSGTTGAPSNLNHRGVIITWREARL